LTLLERGRMLLSVDGPDFTLQPGDLTVTRPWQQHRVGNPHVPAGRLYWLILDVEVRRPHQSWKWPSWLVLSETDLKELTDMLRHNEQTVWRASDELRHTFQRIARAVETKSQGRNISRLTLHLNELFLRVLDMCRHSGARLDTSLSSSYRSVELFLAELASKLSYLAQEWTVPRMAEECGLGVTQFVRHCKQFTNVTPLQYLNNCRLDAARRILLEQSGRSVTQVALDCGFSTPQYFATVFGHRFGCTPRESRENRSRKS
jgi:AraC family L-rhamnose operon regulatory protein RhaS